MEKKNIESILREKSENLHSEVRPKLWDKLEKRMDDHYDSTVSTKHIQFAWIRYAAAFILLIGAGFLLSRLDTTNTRALSSQFTIEEVNSFSEEDKLYQEMTSFSLQYYRSHILPTKDSSTPL